MLISFAFRIPAESRTHADNQQVANYFVTNPHVVTNSFQILTPFMNENDSHYLQNFPIVCLNVSRF